MTYLKNMMNEGKRLSTMDLITFGDASIETKASLVEEILKRHGSERVRGNGPQGLQQPGSLLAECATSARAIGQGNNL